MSDLRCNQCNELGGIEGARCGRCTGIMARERQPGRHMVEAPLALTDYILNWLRSRNGGEFEGTFSTMPLYKFELLKSELELILTHGGKPPNWVK